MFKSSIGILLLILSSMLLFQNCGGTAPSSSPEASAVQQNVEEVELTEEDALEIIAMIPLDGVDWANLTDAEIISEIISRIEEVIAGLSSSPEDLEKKAKLEKALDLIASSAELRAFLVQVIRSKYPKVSVSPTPTSADPQCGLVVNPYDVPRNQPVTLTFQIQSANASAAFLSYWNGSRQISLSAPVNGVKELALPANFTATPDVWRFSVGVINSAGQVRRCDTFVQFR